MARKNDAERLLRGGLRPSDIAREMGISVASVIQYLCTRVGEGPLRFSDLYFSWSEADRELMQGLKDHYGVAGELGKRGLSREELVLFHSLRARQIFRGDMYEYVSEAECMLHHLVRVTLEESFGSGTWWREGVPQGVREKCAVRREQDETPIADLYAYTTLIDLSAIITRNWPLFRSVLPAHYGTNRKRLESDLSKLNEIRNSVMHPVKERKLREADFRFVRQVGERLMECSTSIPSILQE